MCGTNSVIDRISSSGMRVPDSCSILSISDEALRAERCLDISSKSPKNKTYCCGTKCGEKTRLCPACVMQGEIKNGIDLSEFRTADLETGLCKFHTANGEKARKPKKLRQERRVFGNLNTRLFETLAIEASGKGKKKKPIENPNAKRLILTRLKGRADQIASDDGRGVFFPCPALDGYDVVSKFCKAKAIKPEQCESYHCEYFKAEDPESEDDFLEDDFNSDAVLSEDEIEPVDFEEETDLADIVDEIREEAEPDVFAPQGKTLEKVYCPKECGDILSSVCELQSSENSIQLNHCSRYGCKSKWRVCPVCVRKGYPPKAKAMGKNDYFSVDPSTGYCKDHAEYGQDFVKGVGPPQKPRKVTVSVVKKQTENNRKKTLNTIEEDAMPTGKPISPESFLQSGSKAVFEMKNNGQSEDDVAKILNMPKSSVRLAIKVNRLCKKTQAVFLKGDIPVRKIIQLVGISEKAQVEFAEKLHACKGDQKKLEKIFEDIKSVKKKEGVSSKGIGPKKKPSESGKPTKPAAPAKTPESPAASSSEAHLSHLKPGKDVIENMWSSKEEFDAAERDVDDMMSRFEGILGRSDESAILTLSRTVEELARVIDKKEITNSAALPIKQFIIASRDLAMRAVTLLAYEADKKIKATEAAEKEKKAE